MSPALSLCFPKDGSGAYRLLRAGAERQLRRLEAALDDPRSAQQGRLETILRGARGTAFGKAHDLDRVKSLEDFRCAVPIRDHTGHLPWLQRVAAGEPDVLTREPVEMLLETSGTTGTPKRLPVTATWARSVSAAQRLWVLAMLRDHPRVAEGAALTIVSPAVHGRSAGGLPIGSNTGRMHKAQPWWIRARYPVPYDVFRIVDADVRTYCLLRFALQADLRTITTANPSTLLLLARRLMLWREALSKDLADGTLRHGPASDLDRRTRRALRWKLRRRPVPKDWGLGQLWDLACVNCWQGGPAAYFVS
ncbi:MAG: GH3 auxin-responsive promoter family protein, partial [Myxococcota bacterium]|nr:GH3 auxin-responsive promoter family protein [Myxococcota bacterium]